LRQEVRPPALVELLLQLGAPRQEAPPLRTEPALELGDEVQRLRRENLVMARTHRAPDRDALGQSPLVCCHPRGPFLAQDLSPCRLWAAPSRLADDWARAHSMKRLSRQRKRR